MQFRLLETLAAALLFCQFFSFADADAACEGNTIKVSDLCKCKVGFYSADGATSCTSCGAGYTTPSDTTSGTDASACTVCAAGYAGTSSGGSSGCVACVAGKYSAAGDSAGSTTTCTSCTEPGYTTLSDKTSGTDASACNVCAQGYYSNNNGEATGTNDGCTPCTVPGYTTPSVKTSGENDSVCTVCAPGYGISGTGCAACPNLQYKDAHSKAYCSPCQPNRVGCGGDSKGYCDAGYEEKDGSCISCAELNAYKKYPDSASYTGTCIKCQYRTDDCGGPNSGKCLAGFQVPVNGQGCEPCLQGYYKTRAGNYDCSKCSGSTLECGSSSPGSCAKGQGMYEIDVGANMESYICKTCEKGKYNLQSNTPEECSTCSAGNPTCGGQDVGTCTEGYGTDDAGKTCTKCEPNHFKMITGNTPCTSCTQGYAGCSASNPGTRSYPLVPPTIGGGGIAGISIGTGVIVGVLVYAYLHIAHRGQMASLQTHHGKQIKEAEAEGLTP